jgi:hypothetical protein
LQRVVKFDGQESAAQIDPAFDEVLSNLKCQALIKCIGYKSMPVEGVAWDNRKHTIPHEHGIVKDGEGN